MGKKELSEALQASFIRLVEMIWVVGWGGGVVFKVSVGKSLFSDLDGQRLVHLQSHILNAAQNFLLVAG